MKKNSIPNHLRSDCENCFGLCCVALPYAKSADFAVNKEGGTPCSNLQADFRCMIHNQLREKGFRGCVAYECFGAGQKVSQVTYGGKDWRDYPATAKEMFEILPRMQQLHEMLYYLNEAVGLDEASPIFEDLQATVEETESLTNQSSESILSLDIPAHRVKVNELLLRTSERVRAKVNLKKNQKRNNKIGKGSDLIGAKLRGADLRGANLRGALLIAADLRECDLRAADLIGADFRDADLRGADLSGSIFLTQAQVNAARGDIHTKLPVSLRMPSHWLNSGK
ncbi:pentapeptide repeat-containing protein [Cytobacillus sp. FJAT-53684]|uniref:Pentapeptide repeat-containing protein n=1 Tax=Cytobacillus mangrovibacter TaxID=3299024 RepID=A0ABW6K7G3_9BACI